MPDRNFLRQLAADTIKIAENGYYIIGNRKIVLSIEDRNHYYENFNFLPRELKGNTIFENTKYLIKNESVIKTIHSFKKNGLSLGVLNFASAYHPGGGFINGAMAQEEVLTYCSDLYRTLTSDISSQYYEKNKNAKSTTYTDGIVITNNLFFRDENYNLILAPTACTVLTCPAVNMNNVYKAGISVNTAKRIMKNRMRNVLYMFAYSGCMDIILGAWGCGVFKNNAEDIARNWKELLIDENLQKYFNSVTFTVLDKTGNNISPFYKYFE